MASRGLGSLTLDLIAKIAGFTGPLGRAERELDASTKRMNKQAYAFGQSIGKSIKAAAGSFLAFAGVSVSIGAAVSSIKSAIDAADGLRDASIRLGVGTEALSKWGYAAKQTGTDMEALEKGLKLLSRSATAALDPKDAKAGLFKALGVTPDALRDLTVLVPQVADAFKNMADGPQKAAVAMELFGKSGADLIEFLNQGSGGLDEFGDKLERLGGVVTPKTAAAADDFNDKLADLKQQFSGAALMLAEKLLPALISMVDWMGVASDKSSPLGKSIGFLGDQADAAAKDFAFFGESIDAIGRYFDRVGLRGQAFASTLRGVAAATHLDFSKAQEYFDKADASNAQMEASLRWGNVSGGMKVGPQRQGQFSPEVAKASLNFNPNSGKSNSALDTYFATGGRSSGGSSKKSGGKSQAQQDAEKLTAAYDRLKESLSEQVALFGKVGETVKERYDLENGELAKLDPLRKAEVLTLLDKVDALNAEKDAQEKLNKLTQEREEAVNRDIANAAQQIEDMQFELSLLTMTNDQRQREIALRYAGAGATDAQRESIARLSDAMVQGQKEAAFWENAQRSLSDALYDTATGATSALDAAKQFFDNIAKYITRMISDQWAESLMGMFKGSSSGDTSGGGNFFGDLLGALFGGGKASGGMAAANTLYRVNERGFEMATVGGNDYMLTGNSPVNITPNHRLGGGGGNVSQTFVVQGKLDYRSTDQMARQSGVEARRAIARSGG